jgi:hypothetical protein
MATNEPAPHGAYNPYGAPPSQGNGMAVAGLVLGILAVVLFFLTWPAWLLGILGIIFGALGMSKAKRIGGKGKGMGMAGLICGVIGLLVSIIWTVWLISAVNEHNRRWGEVVIQPDTRVAGELVMPAPDAL